MPLNQFAYPVAYKDDTVYAHDVDGVGVITLRTPYLKQGNPINTAVLDGVGNALHALRTHDGVLLTAYSPKPDTPELKKLAEDDPRTLANRRATSVGANVLEFAFDHDLGDPASLDSLDGLLARGQDLSERLWTHPKPLVSAVHGYVLGGGSELFLVPADYILAAPNLVAAFPEKNLGILPGWGGHKLVHKLGLEKTAELFLTGKHVGIDEALRTGYVQELVAQPDELVERGVAKVRELARNGKPAKPTTLRFEGPQHAAKVASLADCACTPGCAEKAIHTAFYDILYKTHNDHVWADDHAELYRRERESILGLLRQDGPRNRMRTFTQSMGKRFAPDALNHWHTKKVN